MTSENTDISSWETLSLQLKSCPFASLIVITHYAMKVYGEYMYRYVYFWPRN
jgi:hypothetical protein